LPSGNESIVTSNPRVGNVWNVHLFCIFCRVMRQVNKNGSKVLKFLNLKHSEPSLY
jgi:hypothetical protein